MLDKLFYFIVLYQVAIYAGNIPNKTNSKTPKNKSKNVSFKDYLETFDPRKVWEKIHKRNQAMGVNTTLEQEFDAVFSGIDETDVLLNVKVQDGKGGVYLQADGRRQENFRPMKDQYNGVYDRYNLKPRLMALMKQAVYQARYKMMIMQKLREKYRRNSVYKMGFLTSKTDITCRTFYRLAYKLFRDCGGSRMGAIHDLPVIDLMAGEERLVSLWFDVDLLVDLVVKNDENCRRMITEVVKNRKHAWKFYD